MKTQNSSTLTFNFDAAHKVDKPHIEEFLSGVQLMGDQVHQLKIKNLLTSVTYETMQHLINAITPHVANFSAFRGYCNLMKEKAYFRNCF